MRANATSYVQDIDGFGCVGDRSANARFKLYCPTCRGQFEKLGPGLKRCGCEINPVACELWDFKCCVCLDTRGEDEICVDGKAVLDTGTRWMHYCAGCKERLTPEVPVVEETAMDEIASALVLPCVSIGDNVCIGKNVSVGCYIGMFPL